jgi:hypothetical protein
LSSPNGVALKKRISRSKEISLQNGWKLLKPSLVLRLTHLKGVLAVNAI